MIRPLTIEDFGTADADYLHRLGFNDREIRQGLYSEQVNEGEVEPEVIRHL